MPQVSGAARSGREWWRRVAPAALAAVVLSGISATTAPANLGLAFTPSSYDYGQVSVGQAASQTFTLTNSSRWPSAPLRVRLSGSGAFSITSDTCSRTWLRSRHSCAITVQFAPTASGPASGTLTERGLIRAASVSLSGSGAAATHLYWARSIPGAVNEGTINEANLDGSNPEAIVSGLNGPAGVAVGISHLCWAEGVLGEINMAGLDGSNPQTIVTGQAASLGGPVGVAVDSSHLYWGNATYPDPGTVRRANLDGSSPQTIVTDQGGPSFVALDSSHLYWTNSFDSTIHEANLDGSDPQTIVTNQARPTGVAVDSSHLYWANYDDGTIREANLDGSSPQTIVTGLNSPIGVAVDSSHLYWVNQIGTIEGTIDEANLDGSNPHPIVTGQVGANGVAVGPQ